MKPTTWLAVAFVVLVAGWLVFSTFHQERVRCQVCMSFQGQRDCLRHQPKRSYSHGGQQCLRPARLGRHGDYPVRE